MAQEQAFCLPHSGAVLFVGGTRSGKSDWALRFAEARATERLFIATALVCDAETRARRDRHQAQRGQGWHTLEAPVDVLPALQTAAATYPVVVVDCITFWLCNLQEHGLSKEQILGSVRELAGWLAASPLPVAVVTSELGQGIVPISPMGRDFRDLAGETNQILAAACPTVVLVTCGLVLTLKGALPQELHKV
ncbi:MAG: bifunctional adenosylcobinamide kinase/adenosylcobinamide-phosphate guanylyltransferase [Desulfovibrionaceae bacterium]